MTTQPSTSTPCIGNVYDSRRIPGERCWLWHVFITRTNVTSAFILHVKLASGRCIQSHKWPKSRRRGNGQDFRAPLAVHSECGFRKLCKHYEHGYHRQVICGVVILHSTSQRAIVTKITSMALVWAHVNKWRCIRCRKRCLTNVFGYTIVCVPWMMSQGSLVKKLHTWPKISHACCKCSPTKDSSKIAPSDSIADAMLLI